MKILFFSLFIACFLFLTGCYCFEIPHEQSEPAYPAHVSGWKEHRKNGARIMGEFVLKRGELIDNGKLIIKIIELLLPELCSEHQSFQHQVRIKMQFIDSVNNKLLGEEEFAQSGSRNISCLGDRDYGIYTVYVNSVNLKDGWVHFELL